MENKLYDTPKLKLREKMAYGIGELPNTMVSVLAAFLTIFQVGVVSTDGDSAAGFVKPYLGQLVFLLDACNHFGFHLSLPLGRS